MCWIFDENENRLFVHSTELDQISNGRASSEGVAALDVHFALLHLGPLDTKQAVQAGCH